MPVIARPRQFGTTKKSACFLPPSDSRTADVHQLLEDHVHDVRNRVRELERMERALVRLKMQCRDGTLHDCPVIDELMN
jgi:hypothetical protein